MLHESQKFDIRVPDVCRWVRADKLKLNPWKFRYHLIDDLIARSVHRITVCGDIIITIK